MIFCSCKIPPSSSLREVQIFSTPLPRRGPHRWYVNDPMRLIVWRRLYWRLFPSPLPTTYLKHDTHMLIAISWTLKRDNIQNKESHWNGKLVDSYDIHNYATNFQWMYDTAVVRLITCGIRLSSLYVRSREISYQIRALKFTWISQSNTSFNDAEQTST